MVELKYIGTHQPKGMIIDVDQERAEKCLASGEYELLEKKKSVVVLKEEKLDDNSNRIKG